MRIAQFIDTKAAGGAERVVIDLAEGLQKRGHKVEVLHFGNPWIEEQCRQKGMSAVRLPQERWYRSKWSIGGFVLRLAQVLRQRRIELLHSHLYGPISAGAVAATAAGIPHVGTLHDVYLIQERLSRFRLLRLVAALGTQLVTVSDDMRRFYLGLARHDMVFERIYNGVDLAGFAPSPERGKEPFTFVSVGRLVPIKGHDVLLDALAKMKVAGARLLLVGDGPERAALETRAAALGLGQRVLFLGFRDDVAAVLAQADAFVLASHSEGLSCSVVEAMAAALPCLVTDVGGNRELVAEGQNGFLVPAGDARALAERMTLLAQDRALARTLGATARERATARFSLDATVSGYVDLYRSVLPPELHRAAS